MKTVSIIIPIFNAEKYLLALFDCFSAFYFEQGDELILIDNGSTDDSYIMCEEYAKKNKYVSVYRYTEKADSYAARNFGVKKARGNILAFTDSDCKPISTWLSEIRRVKEGEVLAGKIELEIIENNLWEHFDRIVHLGQVENAIKNDCVPTANMAVSRDDFMRVGYFEERFSGGDFEWSQRASKKGMIIKFNQNALIIHPSRKTFEEIAVREKRTAYGQGKSYRNNGKSKIKLLLKFLLKIFKIDTNARLTISLAKQGVKLSNLLLFNVRFLQIRCMQVKAANAGYNQVSARELKIK